MTNSPHSIALRVLQDALIGLGQYVGVQIPYQLEPLQSRAESAIAKAKQLTNWSESSELGYLQLVFDAIKLREKQAQPHYWPAVALQNYENAQEAQNDYPIIPYPLEANSAEQFDGLRSEIKEVLEDIRDSDWGNFAILILLLEKYGSHISFGEADVAFFDKIRATAAIATSLGQQPDAKNLCLVAGDLSGIQSFIYTIASDGALKSLRARSFYLELMTEEMIQQLLERLGLPRTSIIYTGGGKSYLIAPANDHTHEIVLKLKAEFNDALFQQFQGKVFLNLSEQNFAAEKVSVSTFAEVWEALNKKISVQKARKFDIQIGDLLKQKEAHEPCRVCHRDDVEAEKLKPIDGNNGVLACHTCRTMFRLGQRLYQVGSLVRSPLKEIPGASTLTEPIHIKLENKDIFYHLFEGSKPLFSKFGGTAETVYVINNWNVALYRTDYFKNPTLLLLGNYGQFVDTEENRQRYKTFISAGEMSDCARGIKRVGHLRMDVDRLGQIFANGLKERYTLARLAGLSRQMSYFFKVYLNSLADRREQNLPKFAKQLSQDLRQNLLFIYAGGDDLFVTGSWNEVVEFAFDVYQSFRAYTGHHPDMTLSGGISLSGPKYPLYQSAEDSGTAEGEAKAQGRDRLTLFGQTFKWGEWLGTRNESVSNIKVIDDKVKDYIGSDPSLALFGVLPFVTELQPLLSINYPQSFVRNLLSTAQIQEQFIKKLKEADKPKAQIDEEVQDIRYFLHLPKVVYTLARLPKEIRETNEYEVIRMSLKSPYNAPYFRAIATWIDLLNRSS